MVLASSDRLEECSSSLIVAENLVMRMLSTRNHGTATCDCTSKPMVCRTSVHPVSKRRRFGALPLSVSDVGSEDEKESCVTSMAFEFSSKIFKGNRLKKYEALLKSFNHLHTC